MEYKCESCRRGFDGRNGNGYSPCGCGKHSPPKAPRPPIIWEPAEPSFEQWFFVMFICLLGIFLILGIIKA